MSDRKVQCSKLKDLLPALAKPPFAGAVGEEIYNKVSERAWRLWSEDMMIKVINEYRLNLADTADYEKLVKQMRAFLCLDESSTQVLAVENPDRGRN